MVAAQQPPPESQKKPPVKPPQQQQEEEPPEEDASMKTEEFVLNPLQANKEINAGNFYFKKGNFRAAKARYARATKWNPGSSEAFLKLGEAEEKLHDKQAARAAYEKYLDLAQDAKNDALRKKIEKWPK
jgi:tetratricopeptide (TPR) repeat protein